MRNYPDLKVAFSEGGIGWIPFYLDRCDRHYTNQKWLRPRLRRQAAERRVPRALAGLLRHRPDVAEAAPRDRHRHHRLGVRLPALRLRSGPTRPSRCWPSSNAAGADDDDINKITWENSCRFFGWDPFTHIDRKDGDRRRAAGAGDRRRHLDEVACRVAQAVRGTARPPRTQSGSALPAAQHRDGAARTQTVVTEVVRRVGLLRGRWQPRATGWPRRRVEGRGVGRPRRRARRTATPPGVRARAGSPHR